MEKDKDIEKAVPIHGNVGGEGLGAKGYTFSTDELLQAIEGTYGNVSLICINLSKKRQIGKKVSRNTALKYILSDIEAKQAFSDEREMIVDSAEEALLMQIQAGEPSMIRFALSSKFAKNRGWGSDVVGLATGSIYENEADKPQNETPQVGSMTVLTAESLDIVEKMIVDLSDKKKLN